ncbi:TBC1 domain family member 7 [Porphyridium purpureum]|uniref:TBC1 domain family member 7 n=1 Tax=Porphyridium purpureum TaxID=35688 RepID=A0A5J4Z6Z6_PORPP|nr:TBC1 domain family member 7 [Porphyridium purpureum]|eukprot:POR2589..scf295_1
MHWRERRECDVKEPCAHETMNFRANYLASLGFEKETLAKTEFDSLLSDQLAGAHVSLENLRKLSVRLGVPVKWRPVAWKLLLGVLPPHFAAWASAALAHSRTYNDLLKASRIVCTYKVLLALGLDKVDAFWAMVKFLERQEIVVFSERSGQPLHAWGILHRIMVVREIVQRDEPDFYKHLDKLGIHDEQFLSVWFRSFFAECFSSAQVVSIWDRLISTPSDYIVFVAISLVQALKDTVVKCTSAPECMKLLLKPKGILIESLWNFAFEKQTYDISSDIFKSSIRMDLHWPVVKMGDRSPLVWILQYLLRFQGLTGLFAVDGYYGQRTVHAVDRLLNKMKSSELGNADAATRSLSRASLSKEPVKQQSTRLTNSVPVADKSPRASADQFESSTCNALLLFPQDTLASIGNHDPRRIDSAIWPYLAGYYATKGTRGDIVRAIQTALVYLHGYKNLRVDGVFGQNTLDVVKDFQSRRSCSFTIDGVVGPITWLQLIGVPDP